MGPESLVESDVPSGFHGQSPMKGLGQTQQKPDIYTQSVSHNTVHNTIHIKALHPNRLLPQNFFQSLKIPCSPPVARPLVYATDAGN